MKLQLDLYLHLRYRIQDWLLGRQGCCDLANYCGMTLTAFKEQLIMWGVMDVVGKPADGIGEQDVFNVIFMLQIKRLATPRYVRG